MILTSHRTIYQRIRCAYSEDYPTSIVSPLFVNPRYYIMYTTCNQKYIIPDISSDRAKKHHILLITIKSIVNISIILLFLELFRYKIIEYIFFKLNCMCYIKCISEGDNTLFHT